VSTITHIQGGARFECAGRRTKKALKEAIAADPTKVELYATSSMGPQFSGTADQLPEDAEFSVVGPDPYTRRDWYATVKWGVRGTLTVS
jgi:hypothetical protein